jgi:hypothetical protein
MITLFIYLGMIALVGSLGFCALKGNMDLDQQGEKEKNLPAG